MLVQGLPSIAALAVGKAHNLALAADGRLWAWGQNNDGQLCEGSNQTRTTPTQVRGLTNIQAIAAGHAHSLALTADGQIYVWGRNGSGQFGNGTTAWTESSAIPVPVTAIAGASAIAASYASSYAVLSDGSLWSWGRNASGQLGLGYISDRETTPLQAVALSDVQTIHSDPFEFPSPLAGTADGRLWVWGHNGHGQFGNGSLQALPSPTPTLVDTTAFPSGVEALAKGILHVVALLNDGSLWTWGNNWYGQLGLGFGDDRWLPVQIDSLRNVATIGAGSNHTLAMTADGFVWSWGSIEEGRLGIGLGYPTHRDTPTAVLNPDGIGQLNLLADAEKSLTVAIAGSGTVASSDGRISCPGTCAALYQSPSAVTLQAAPAPGWTFTGWGGACTGKEACTVTVDRPLSVTANFTATDARFQLDSPVNDSFESGIGGKRSVNCI